MPRSTLSARPAAPGPRRARRDVRRAARIALVAAVAAPVLAAGCGGGEEGGPRSAGPALEGPLACAAPVLDFGRVDEGRVLAARFDLVVERDEPVTVRAVRADCGCTATELLAAPGGDPSELTPYQLETPLPPGALLRVGAQYDTTGKRGRESREVTLYADVPDGRVALALVADVQPWLVAEPDVLNLGRIGRGEAREGTLRVRSVDGTPFALEHERRAVPDALVVELRPVEPDPDGRAAAWDVVVTAGPGMPEGAHHYPLYLVADHVLAGGEAAGAGSDEPLRARAVPQVVLEAVGLFRVEPGTLSFGAVAPDATAARSARVVCHDPEARLTPRAHLEPAGVTDREGSEALLRTAHVDVRPAGERSWDVQLLLEGLDPGVGERFLARIVLETGHPDQPRLEVPVLGYRASRGEPSHPTDSSDRTDPAERSQRPPRQP